MASADLNEANAINATRQRLTQELKLVAATATPEARPGLTFAPIRAGSSMKQGLLVKEYPRSRTQTDYAKVYIPVQDMGQPLSKSYTIKSLLEWKFNAERNAVASGFINIEKDGVYQFNSNSFYDRNVLIVNDEEICKFVDGEAVIASIELKKGLVPITSIGYVETRGVVTVKWRPPGQAELSEIPPKLLSHQ